MISTVNIVFTSFSLVSVTRSLPTSEVERLQEWNDSVYGGRVNIVEDQDSSKGSSCIWLQGNYGQSLICPAYYAAAGVCGSGYRNDCNGHYKVNIKKIKPNIILIIFF